MSIDCYCAQSLQREGNKPLPWEAVRCGVKRVHLSEDGSLALPDMRAGEKLVVQLTSNIQEATAIELRCLLQVRITSLYIS